MLWRKDGEEINLGSNACNRKLKIFPSLLPCFYAYLELLSGSEIQEYGGQTMRIIYTDYQWLSLKLPIIYS